MSANQSPQPPNEAMFRAIMDWGNENATQIWSSCHLKGGWEGWVYRYIYIQEEMRDLFDAAREDNCYLNNDRLAADLVISPPAVG